MMITARLYNFLVVILLSTRTMVTTSALAAPGQPPPGVVRAVMFWMDGCPHCDSVLDEVLPPLQSQYQNQLEIFLIELKSAEDADRLYQTAGFMGLTKEEVGVPFLIIGEHVLVGSDQIPAQLPGLIEKYLAQGGVGYPDIDALAPILPTPSNAGSAICAPATPCPETATEPAIAAAGGANPSTQASLRSNGFALAWMVLAGMAAALLFTGVYLERGPYPNFMLKHPLGWKKWAIPALCLVGMGVAGYLAYVETQMVEAFCGPVGDCNAVQASPYARLFGVLPVGVLGIAGYVAILAAWFWEHIRRDRIAQLASRANFGLTLAGTIFSLYLTTLELFVIKAVCIWCILSAVIMTLLLLLSLGPAVVHLPKEKKDAQTSTP